ncbi:type II toxin-antitoxin system RelE/ParE family toxin [Desulfitobacterium sp.]|uniref:type II toxin-antitoxin system RelE/ParE family toxin n=1 Tax=Desulfitobacterium sp. TaxID=49981 RepID=UPI002B1EA702|nr:type II toxin-antitoxin system RelE/ParE family toxin [Desulfitobacterium sp.]MEA4900538.1 type II toxin-antitoxin system RelE/ParE family toxin [Desulfitobacterium sp.]
MDKKYRIEYLPVAQDDLTSIVEYIQVDDPLAAMNFLDVVDKTISKLAYFPYLGAIPKDIRLMHLNYRVLIIDNYLVFYVVLEEVVEIRRILHGKRQYSFLL